MKNISTNILLLDIKIGGVVNHIKKGIFSFTSLLLNQVLSHISIVLR